MRPRSAMATALFLGILLPLSAAVQLPATYNDHMLFQQNIPFRVQGWCSGPVKVTFLGKDYPASCSQGLFDAVLPATSGAQPATELVIADEASSITLSDVVFGDLFICR